MPAVAASPARGSLRQPAARRWLRELAELLAFPTVAALPRHRRDLEAAACWLAAHARGIGLEHARVLPGANGGPPSVYADWLHTPGRPVLLLYGHYDVQPAGDLSAWRSPPFRATLRHGAVYARGASDDKGQLFIQLKALERCFAAAGRLPLNVKLWIEGEEEIASPNLSAFLDREAGRLCADAMLVSDTQMLGPRQPSLVYGLRGKLDAVLDVSGPAHALHSGLFGGAVLNPLHALCTIVAGLQDARGRTTVPGFYRGVRIPSFEECRALRAHLPSDDALRARLGVPALHGEPGYSAAERMRVRPALTVTSVTTGGPGSAAIPARARAHIDVRLVPEQEPVEIARSLARHVAAATPPGVRAGLRVTAMTRPALIRTDGRAMRAAARAVERVWGVSPALLRSGGTIPAVAQLHQRFGMPAVLLGFGLPEDNAHGPNERIGVARLFRGVETVVRFFTEYAA
jgi:acetylornithine deacetylase/succinyl-diaminopimelate desuccinylase-like protein